MECSMEPSPAAITLALQRAIGPRSPRTPGHAVLPLRRCVCRARSRVGAEQTGLEHAERVVCELGEEACYRPERGGVMMLLPRCILLYTAARPRDKIIVMCTISIAWTCTA